jgi:hypothetical protein
MCFWPCEGKIAYLLKIGDKKVEEEIGKSSGKGLTHAISG